ncbi:MULTISPECIES: hormogonium polysaccharide biosynthesis glycosyltransferase HpsN [unclassified Coleofasciculus]|uniref:hormogonium polysaccharide biosynthesis glycosyltransferase HpsN n=1 Tax=unclassified Coleofasciculus TaxID=2692782 RepID=UPI00187F7522|nr:MULTISPECIES: hormogonium polysaccharide biosynthesis glycosyltransferase HpsN [unclassified Coleofasciculus]MBE9128805.1 glycosyltransferase family 2 protein [Coleofasciculus sp. LEGE 07081]MBE9149440.1 glycosyltransferase family 2 protein [Coleofasciculus sp. LEGE 07092]
MTLPSLSVIIPTYSREEPLRDTLDDVLKQEYPCFEVLVVDQTPTHKPEIQAYLEQLANDRKITWFRVDWASLPGARNYGVRRASGEIMVFIDDDIKMPAGYLQAHARNYQRHEVGAVAGRVFDRMKLADSQWANKGDSPYTIEDLPPQAMDPGIAWYYIDLVHTVKPQRVISARGCNMSYRREIFTQYGIWFDERFRGSAVREESDFCLRSRKTGYHIWYDPDAYLVHLGEETGGCHDISTRSLKYQMTFYHNHFLMAMKNLTLTQQLHLFAKLFDCHVLGNPPCNKSGSPIKIISRAGFYSLGFLDALSTLVKSSWDKGQIYTQLDKEAPTPPIASTAPVSQ